MVNIRMPCSIKRFMTQPVLEKETTMITKQIHLKHHHWNEGGNLHKAAFSGAGTIFRLRGAQMTFAVAFMMERNLGHSESSPPPGFRPLMFHL